MGRDSCNFQYKDEVDEEPPSRLSQMAHQGMVLPMAIRVGRAVMDR